MLDMFNQLPEELLCSILSWLPIKDAVKTSILSQRWRRLWTLIPSIDFDEDTPGSIIDSIFSDHRHNINYCRLSHYQRDWESGDVLRWIKHLQSNSIQKLLLNCIDRKYLIYGRLHIGYNVWKLPPRIFSCMSLHVLELTNYWLLDASSFMGCVNLATLVLNSVRLSDDTLTSIISNLVFLENLSLQRCNGLRKINACHQNLKSLELGALYVREIKIEAVNLTFLVISSLFLSKYDYETPNIKIYSPNLQMFSTYQLLHDQRNKDCEAFHGRENRPEILELCIGIYEKSPYEGPKSFLFNRHACSFQNLHRICINVNLNDIREAIVVSYMLRVCLCLQELDIKIESDDMIENDAMPNLSNYWQNREIFDSVTYHLRRVRMRGFRGHVLELEFAKHLISRATKLKMMTIRCHDKCSKRGAAATMLLHSLPKASIDASIVILKHRSSCV